MVSSIFPLPPVGPVQSVHGADLLGGRLRRRLLLRNTLLGLLRHAVASINSCAFAALGSRGRAPARRTASQPTGSHWTIRGRLLGLCRQAGLPPRQSPKEALCELLKVENLDGDFDPSAVVPFEWSKLKLLRESWQVRPKEILDIAPTEIRQWFLRPGQFRLSMEAAQAVADKAGPITPYWDVILGTNAKV